jgi:hypothetical protein
MGLVFCVRVGDQGHFQWYHWTTGGCPVVIVATPLPVEVVSSGRQSYTTATRESRLPRTERTVECANAQQERGKNPQYREKKLLTAQRPRTYTHPTRPIKLLGPPRAYLQPPPTGQAPVIYAARCIHVPPGNNS